MSIDRPLPNTNPSSGEYPEPPKKRYLKAIPIIVVECQDCGDGFSFSKLTGIVDIKEYQRYMQWVMDNVIYCPSCRKNHPSHLKKREALVSKYCGNNF